MEYIEVHNIAKNYRIYKKYIKTSHLLIVAGFDFWKQYTYKSDTKTNTYIITTYVLVFVIYYVQFMLLIKYYILLYKMYIIYYLISV